MDSLRLSSTCDFIEVGVDFSKLFMDRPLDLIFIYAILPYK